MKNGSNKNADTLIADMKRRNVSIEKRGNGQRARPFIFTKIPRTASESMHGILKQGVFDYVRINQANHAKVFYSNPLYSHVNVCHNHTPVAALLREKCLTKTEFKRRFSFTFIRNPWARIISVWNLLNSWEQAGKKTLVQGKSLNEFAVSLRSSRYAKTRPCSLRFYLTSHQWSWAYPEFSFVGRYEQIGKDWTAVCKAIGIDLSLSRHTKMYSKTEEMKKPPAERLSQEAADAIHEVYKEDCFIGGYDSVGSSCNIDSDEILSRSKKVWESKLR